MSLVARLVVAGELIMANGKWEIDLDSRGDAETQRTNIHRLRGLTQIKFLTPRQARREEYILDAINGIYRIDINHRATEDTETRNSKHEILNSKQYGNLFPIWIGRRAALPPGCLRGRAFLEINPDFCGSPSPSTTRLASLKADL